MDNWKKVLIGLYGAALSGEGFSSVDRTSMNMKGKDFGWALYQLQMRGFVEGCKFNTAALQCKNIGFGEIRNSMVLTPSGFEKADAIVKTELIPEIENEATNTVIQHFIAKALRDAGVSLMADIIMSHFLDEE